MRCGFRITVGVVMFLAGGAKPEVALQSPLELSGRDDALAVLYRDILQINVGEGTTVRAVFGGLPEAEVHFRRAIEPHVTPSGVRRYGDGSVDVDVVIAMKQVVAALEGVRGRFPALQKRLKKDFSIQAVGDRLYATGLAYPQPMVVTLATTQPASQPTEAQPPGWRHLTRRQRDGVAEAAMQQALTTLFDDVRRIQIGGGRTIGSLLRLVPEQTAQFRAVLARAAVYEIELDPAQVCTARCEVSAAVAADFLSPAVTSEQLGSEVLSSTGYAASPGGYVTRGGPVPAWCGRTMIAVAKASAADSKQARVSATVMAKVKLAEKINALDWPEGGTVGDRIGAAGASANNLAIYFTGTRTLGVREDAGEVTVTVEIPLRRLYDLLAGRTE